MASRPEDELAYVILISHDDVFRDPREEPDAAASVERTGGLVDCLPFPDKRFIHVEQIAVLNHTEPGPDNSEMLHGVGS